MTTTPARLSDRLRALRDHLTHGLIEREVPARVMLLALLGGAHVILLGPPGTAKSELARRMHRALRDGGWFERLLTRFTVPEELFGPISLKELEEDRYRRLTAGYLPSSSVAFLDEIFKANSAILNALLTLLNERLFDNGTQRQRVPLVSVVAASNELPEGDELAALYDRFLVRFSVGPVSHEAFADLLAAPREASEVPLALRLTDEELARVRENARGVSISPELVETIGALRRYCEAQEIAVSDRRWVQALDLLRVSAFTNDRNAIDLWDLFLLEDCLWSKPEQRAVIREWLRGHVGVTVTRPARLVEAVEAQAARLAKEREATQPKRDKKGPLYIGLDGKPTHARIQEQQRKDAKGERLYVWRGINNPTNDGKGYAASSLRDSWGNCHVDLGDPANFFMESVALEPALEPMRYSDAHVAGRVRAVDELLAAVEDHREGLARRIEALDRALDAHLWLDPAFAPVARKGVVAAHGEAEKLAARLREIRTGFEKLPRSEDP